MRLLFLGVFVGWIGLVVFFSMLAGDYWFLSWAILHYPTSRLTVWWDNDMVQFLVVIVITVAYAAVIAAFVCTVVRCIATFRRKREENRGESNQRRR